MIAWTFVPADSESAALTVLGLSTRLKKPALPATPDPTVTAVKFFPAAVNRLLIAEVSATEASEPVVMLIKLLPDPGSVTVAIV